MTLIIFDCDGTIVDSQHGIVAAMDGAYQREGLTPPTRADVLSIVGLSLPEVFAALSPHASRDVQRRLAENYKAAFQSIRAEGHEEALYPGARDVITSLAKRPGTQLAIATGKSIRGVERILTQERWHGLFVSIQTADTNPSKPNPAMITTAVAEATAARGQAPDAVVMIGDTSYDMLMARNAGVHALGVAWGYHETDMLLRTGAQAIAQHFTEVPDWIDRLTAAKPMGLRS